MIRTIFTVIFYVCFFFDIFMATPFGIMWAISDWEKERHSTGYIIAFSTAIPMLLIGNILGII